MRYRANNRYNTTLTAAFDGASDVTMKVKELPDYLPTLITLNYAQSTESTWEATGSSGTDTLTGLTLKKGTAQLYYQGTTVDSLNWAEYFNQYYDVSTFFFAEDNTSYSSWDDQYDLLISDDTFDLVRGTMVAFEPTQTNTGAVTIKINSLDPVELTKNGGEDLVAGDMVAGQIMTMMFDGLDLQLLSLSAEEATSLKKGISRPDNTTITVDGGIITATGRVNLLAASDTAPASCSTGDKYYDTGDAEIYTATGTDTWGTTGVTPSPNLVYYVPTLKVIMLWNGSALLGVNGCSVPQDVSGTTVNTTVNGIKFLNFSASNNANTTLTPTMADGDACEIILKNTNTESAITFTFTGVTATDLSTAFTVEVAASGTAWATVKRWGTSYVGRTD